MVRESGGLTKEQTLTTMKIAIGAPEYMAPAFFKPQSSVRFRRCVGRRLQVGVDHVLKQLLAAAAAAICFALGEHFLFQRSK